jgi:hypothetical protein
VVEANGMSGGNYTTGGNTFLLATSGPEDEIFLGLFIIAAFWALLSGAVVLLSIHEMAQRSAWRAGQHPWWWRRWSWLIASGSCFEGL